MTIIVIAIKFAQLPFAEKVFYNVVISNIKKFHIISDDQKMLMLIFGY